MRREPFLSLSIVACLAAACAPPPDLGTRRPLRVGSQEQESTTTPGKGTSSSGSKAQGSSTSETTSAPDVVPTPSKGCNGGMEKAQQPSGLSANMSIQVSGSDRSYDLEVPDGYDPDHAYPVVFVFHGSGGTAGQARTGFNFAGVAGDKALFVYPNGRNREWDLDSAAGNNQDVALFDSIKSNLETTYCIDSSRIFATGFSNGAYFSNQLGCLRGDRLRAIASHGGGGPYGGDDAYDHNGNLKCAGPSPAALIVHGDADAVVTVDQSESSLRHWKWANGCSGDTSESSPHPCVSFDGCKKPVESCRIPGLGHWLWAEGTKTTWNFFASF